MPYNHLLFNDTREPLVEVAAQILVVTLDHTQSSPNASTSIDGIEDSGEVSELPLCFYHPQYVGSNIGFASNFLTFS